MKKVLLVGSVVVSVLFCDTNIGTPVNGVNVAKKQKS